MKQKSLEIDVRSATDTRLEFVFSQFDNIVVAFSGGKDSGVLLNATAEYRDKHYPGRRISILHLDYEAQYQATTDYVDRVLERFAETDDIYHCCVPFKVTTCTSMHQTFWRPWDSDLQNIWVRSMPDGAMTAADFDFFRLNMWDYDFQKEFSRWIHVKNAAQRTCCLVGIRAQESLDRWRTIVSDRNINKYSGTPWTSMMFENVYNAYPIYDWQTEDIWTAVGRSDWDYNKLYDLFQLAGVPLNAQRVASPFISAAKGSLHLYRAIDPNTWGKLVSRVNGVNFTAIYGATKTMGFKEISKPPHFTWHEYAMFLLDTLPPDTADGFRKKLATSIAFWRQSGGVLSEETIGELAACGIKFELNTTGRRTAKSAVKMDYIDDIDSKDFRLIPSWKRVCVTILKNDHVGKYMGFTLTKHEMDKRAAAIEKYKGL